MAKKNPALRRLGRKYHATHRLPWYKPKKTTTSATDEQAPPASKKAAQSPPRKKKRPDKVV